MSRLKLKRFKAKTPPDEVLAQYLLAYPSQDLYLRPDDLPPISPEELFGTDQPFVFDLGCGRGGFLAAQAQAYPEQNFVGFDLHWKSVWDAINKAHAAGLENVKFIRADFRRALAIVPDESVRDAFLLFPPPVLKHGKRQQDPLPRDTIRHLHRVLVPDGAFHFVTDHPAFFQVKVDLITDTGLFPPVQTSQQIEGGLTRFQRFWESLNIESLRSECRKV